MKDKVLAKLFEGFDKQLLSEEVQTEVSSLIDQMVAAKVADATKSLQEKEAKLKSWLEEQNKVLVEKETVLKDVAKNFAEKCATEMAEKEKVLFESLNEYVQRTQEIAAEEGKILKDHVMQIALENCKEYQAHIEGVTLEQLKEHKITQEAALAREVDGFKEKIVSSISEFMDARFESAIPKNIMEAAVQVAAYKPLVEGMIKTFAKGYVQFDSTGLETIKEAKSEAEKLTESLNAKIKDNVRLSARVKELEKADKISSLLEGLTAKQKDKAKFLLEKCEFNELDTTFKRIKDTVIEESVRKPIPSQNITETAKKQIQKLQESVNNVTVGADPEMSSWAKTLNRDLKG